MDRLIVFCFAESAGGAAGQADSAGLPPGSVVSAPARGGGRGERRSSGETPRDGKQTEAAAGRGGAGPQQPAAASGKTADGISFFSFLKTFNFLQKYSCHFFSHQYASHKHRRENYLDFSLETSGLP